MVSPYRSHSIYPSIIDYTEILHGFEAPPPMSMPDILMLEVAELEGAVTVTLDDILAIVAIGLLPTFSRPDQKGREEC